MKDISTLEFLAELNKEIDKASSMRELADKWGCKYQQIQQARDCHTTPCEQILKGMKLEAIKEIKYRYRGAAK